jgi:uncharacterized phage-associated protein
MLGTDPGFLRASWKPWLHRRKNKEAPIVRPPYDPRIIANRFLEKQRMSPMKLVKLVYFAHGWHLALKDEPLINEAFQAWDFGPMAPTLYQEFKRYGNEAIEKEAKVEEPVQCDSFTSALIEHIWGLYGKYSPIQLSNMTHFKGAPWETVTASAKSTEGFIPRHLEIPDETIKQYFISKLKKPSNG